MCYSFLFISLFFLFISMSMSDSDVKHFQSGRFFFMPLSQQQQHSLPWRAFEISRMLILSLMFWHSILWPVLLLSTDVEQRKHTKRAQPFHYVHSDPALGSSLMRTSDETKELPALKTQTVMLPKLRVPAGQGFAGFNLWGNIIKWTVWFSFLLKQTFDCWLIIYKTDEKNYKSMRLYTIIHNFHQSNDIIPVSLT